jgi:hypothetical protein
MKTTTRYLITRTSTSTGRKLYLTESRTAGVSFEAPGNTVTGVGVANLKTWGTKAGAQKWLNARPGYADSMAKAGMPLAIEEAN